MKHVVREARDLQIGDFVPVAKYRGDPGSRYAIVVKVLPIPVPPRIRVTFEDGHTEDYQHTAAVWVARSEDQQGAVA